jgi:hypothetical protein
VPIESHSRSAKIGLLAVGGVRKEHPNADAIAVNNIPTRAAYSVQRLSELIFEVSRHIP